MAIIVRLVTNTNNMTSITARVTNTGINIPVVI